MPASLPQAVVMGNAALDETFALPALPRPGESLLCHPPTRDPGGKGANQALVLARCGLAVQLVARIGRDPEGQFLRNRLGAEGLASHLIEAPEPTDRSIILLDPAGENCIVTACAAAGALTPADATRAVTRATRGALLLLQGNLTFETTRAALAAAHNQRMITIFNPAPVKQEFSTLWPLVTLAVLNQREAEQLTKATNETAANRILSAGAQAVAITRGPHGAILLHRAGLETIPAHPAEPVDTTGAGDTFTAMLAAARYAHQLPWKDALSAAAEAAAITVSTRGAFASLPTRAALTRILTSFPR